MLMGVASILSRGVAAARGCSKIALGINPNQPFELRSWLHQWFQGGAGPMQDARAAGASDSRAVSMMNNINSQQPQQARMPQPPPPTR